jgi:hypothetical protein
VRAAERSMSVFEIYLGIAKTGEAWICVAAPLAGAG